MQRTPLKALAVCRECGTILDPAWNATAYVGRLGVRCIECWDGDWDRADGKNKTTNGRSGDAATLR